MSRRALAIGIVALGSLQMLGHVLGVAVLAGFGAATGASPAPKVFSAVQGLETYSTRFYFEWTDAAGDVVSVRLTPELYARISGPYNRRNVYGAALAYAPVLATDDRARPMLQAVLGYALCGAAPLLAELGVDPVGAVGPVRIRLEPLAETSLPLVFEPPCR